MKNTAILLVQCPDRSGLDAAIADFIFRHGGNILHFEQHQAGEERFYLARIEWDLSGFQLDLKDFAGRFDPVAEKLGMRWRGFRIAMRRKIWWTWKEWGCRARSAGTSKIASFFTATKPSSSSDSLSPQRPVD